MEERIFFLLRLGMLGCFVGHGAWGIITKAGWLPFFHVFFIPDQMAYSLMPFIGFLDIILGILLFIRPMRALVLWAAFWTIFTAILRPSAAMGMSEFFERAGNFGVPLACMAITGFTLKRNELFQPLSIPSPIKPERLLLFERILHLSLVSLLAGHGGLSLFCDSKLITSHFHFIGLNFGITGMHAFGLFEIGLAFLVLVKPRLAGLMLFVFFYKLVCEFMHPVAGRSLDILETIERIGDYVIPLMLWIIYRNK